jgi:hypothetical protein
MLIIIQCSRQNMEIISSFEQYNWLKNVTRANALFERSVYHFDDLFRHTVHGKSYWTAEVKGVVPWQADEIEKLEAYRKRKMTWPAIGKALNRTAQACRLKNDALNKARQLK